MSQRCDAMAVLIEPAPYIIQLLKELQEQWEGEVHGRFVARVATQDWGWQSETSRHQILPSPRPLAIAALCHDIFRIRPSIVFVAGWSHPIVIVAIIMARLTGANVVCMSDTWISETKGPRAWLKRAVLGLIHAFTPGGSQQARYLRRQGVPAERIFAAGMTSDTRAIQEFMAERGAASRAALRHEIGVSEADVVFLFVGRLERVKGPDLLVEAFNRAQMPEGSRLIVVGDGSLKDGLNKKRANNPRILLRGRLEGEALLAHFAMADVFVLPSRSEPWGLVVNEAMAAGLAVIVNDCCGCIDDLVVDAENGIITPTGDVGALSSALDLLSNHPSKLAALQKSAQKHIAEWTTESWAKNIVAVWRKTSDSTAS